MKKLLFTTCFIFALTAQAEEVLIQEIPLEAPTPQKEFTEPTTPAPTLDVKHEGTLDDLYTQLDTQAQALKELTERLEQTDHRLQLAEEQLTRMNQDISFRLTELENKPIPEPVFLDKTSDKERYEYAYNLLKNNDYKAAEQQFVKFLADFPNSDLKPNALYWLGENYYAQAKFEQAVGQFADVFTNYPKSNKAPDALLKMGLSMLNLKKKAEACTAFIALPNEYPKAEETLKKRAKEEAQKNKCS